MESTSNFPNIRQSTNCPTPSPTRNPHTSTMLPRFDHLLQRELNFSDSLDEIPFPKEIETFKAHPTHLRESIKDDFLRLLRHTNETFYKSPTICFTDAGFLFTRAVFNNFGLGCRTFNFEGSNYVIPLAVGAIGGFSAFIGSIMEVGLGLFIPNNEAKLYWQKKATLMALNRKKNDNITPDLKPSAIRKLGSLIHEAKSSEELEYLMYSGYKIETQIANWQDKTKRNAAIKYVNDMMCRAKEKGTACKRALSDSRRYIKQAKTFAELSRHFPWLNNAKFKNYYRLVKLNQYKHYAIALRDDLKDNIMKATGVKAIRELLFPNVDFNDNNARSQIVQFDQKRYFYYEIAKEFDNGYCEQIRALLKLVQENSEIDHFIFKYFDKTNATQIDSQKEKHWKQLYSQHSPSHSESPDETTPFATSKQPTVNEKYKNWLIEKRVMWKQKWLIFEYQYATHIPQAAQQKATQFITAFSTPHKKKKLHTQAYYNSLENKDDQLNTFLLEPFYNPEIMKDINKVLSIRKVKATYFINKGLRDGTFKGMTTTLSYYLWDIVFNHLNKVLLNSGWKGWGSATAIAASSFVYLIVFLLVMFTLRAFYRLIISCREKGVCSGIKTKQTANSGSKVISKTLGYSTTALIIGLIQSFGSVIRLLKYTTECQKNLPKNLVNTLFIELGKVLLSVVVYYFVYHLGKYTLSQAWTWFVKILKNHTWSKKYGCCHIFDMLSEYWRWLTEKCSDIYEYCKKTAYSLFTFQWLLPGNFDDIDLSFEV